MPLQGIDPSRIVRADTPSGYTVLPTPKEVGEAIAKDCLEILRKALTPSEHPKVGKSTIRK